MTRLHYAHGAALALVSAGPSFILLLLLGAVIREPRNIAEFGELWSILAILPVAMAIGMVIALIPVLLGGLAMAWLGAQATGMRHPIAWAVAGAAIGTLMSFIFDNSGRTGLIAPFLHNGAISALIVRYGTRWDDEAPPAPINKHEGEEK